MVEQWPFKPFVTGSNPVRPIKNMFKKLLFVIYFIPLFSFSQTVSINDKLGNKLNANYINNDSSKIIVLILHGTRGHKKLELIQTLLERFSDSNIDTLSMNLSYGITNRNDDFLPCDIIHDHLNSKSLSEIRLWFDFIKQKNKYKKIILLGAVITMKIEYYNAVYEECSFIDSLFASLADIKLIPEKFRRLDKI